MALAALVTFGPALQRAAAMLICFITVFSAYVLADIWRIERRRGRSVSALAIAFLATALIAVGALFGCFAINRSIPTEDSCPTR